MLWFLAVSGLLLFIYFCFVKPFNYWSERGVTQFKFWITWREILLGFVQYRSISESIEIIYNSFPASRYIGIYQFLLPTIFLRDPDLIKQIGVKDFDHFVDHYQFFPENSEPLWEKNLFSLTGDKWRDMRATLSPSFTSSKMKIMFGLISECAKQFVQCFEQQAQQTTATITLEMKDAFTRFTNDVIASSAFGITCNSLKDRNNEFYLMGKKITDFGGAWKNLKFILILMMPKLSKAMGIKIFEKKITQFFTKLVKDNIQVREREGIFRPDMIHLLLEARTERGKHEKLIDNDVNEGFAATQDPLTEKEVKPQKEQLTDEDIVAQALIFFFAGFDSVSTLMCFMAYELAVNPDIQTRLQSEVDNTMNNCKGSVTYAALSNMKYMDMVISESLRKWPGGVVVDRVCAKPYTIEPVKRGEAPLHLKKGDVVWFPIFGLHRDPHYYAEPERFDPERFNDDNKANITPYTFIPFGVGPRNCIGNRFALMETKLVFFHLLSKFDIKVVDKTVIPIKLERSQFQLNAEGGFWLGLKSRNLELQ